MTHAVDVRRRERVAGAEITISLDVTRRSDGHLQLSINATDKDGGHGYRIAGPKFDGTETTVLRKVLDGWDVRQITSYLNAYREGKR